MFLLIKLNLYFIKFYFTWILILLQKLFVIATQTVNQYEEEGKLKDNIIRCSISENSDMAKTIQMKQMSTISVQTENSDSEYSNFITRKNADSVHQQDDNKFKRKQQNIVGLKEHIIGHHQPGEIPQ